MQQGAFKRKLRTLTKRLQAVKQRQMRWALDQGAGALSEVGVVELAEFHRQRNALQQQILDLCETSAARPRRLRMRHGLLLLLLALTGLMGCAARSPHVYTLQPPVDGIAVGAEDWSRCDLRADREGQGAYQTPPRQMQRQAWLGAALGAIGGAIAGSLSSDITPDERAAAREAAYDEMLRMCLRGRGYPVAGRDAPSFVKP